METVIEFYRKQLGFKDFYNIIKNNVISNPTEYVQNRRFLETIEINKKLEPNNIKTDSDYLRIDVPVWFGNYRTTKYKVLVAGLEPRDTNEKFNVEQSENIIFACPFGIDRWNEHSSIEGKPQNKYYRTFSNLVNDDRLFVLFTDVVKEYEVKKKSSKQYNDIHARKYFEQKAEQDKDYFCRQLNLLEPDFIITLGNKVYSVVNKLVKKNYEIFLIRHPSQGGEQQAKLQLSNFIQKI